MKLNSQDYIDLSNGNYISPNQETGTTTTSLKAYGISTVPYSTAANLFTLGAPITGVEKTLILNSTLVADSTAITLLSNTLMFIVSSSIITVDYKI